MIQWKLMRFSIFLLGKKPKFLFTLYVPWPSTRPFILAHISAISWSCSSRPPCYHHSHIPGPPHFNSSVLPLQSDPIQLICLLEGISNEPQYTRKKTLHERHAENGIQCGVHRRCVPTLVFSTINTSRAYNNSRLLLSLIPFIFICLLQGISKERQCTRKKTLHAQHAESNQPTGTPSCLCCRGKWNSMWCSLVPAKGMQGLAEYQRRWEPHLWLFWSLALDRCSTIVDDCQSNNGLRRSLGRRDWIRCDLCSVLSWDSRGPVALARKLYPLLERPRLLIHLPSGCHYSCPIIGDQQQRYLHHCESRARTTRQQSAISSNVISIVASHEAVPLIAVRRCRPTYVVPESVIVQKVVVQ